MEMGIPGQFDHPDAVYDTVIVACHKHGKHPGMGGVYDPAMMAQYVGKGMKFILSGSDMAFMMADAKAQAAAVRELNQPRLISRRLQVGYPGLAKLTGMLFRRL